MSRANFCTSVGISVLGLVCATFINAQTNTTTASSTTQATSTSTTSGTTSSETTSDPATSSNTAADLKPTECEGGTCSGGELERSVIGFEQSGASSAKSLQKFFFDFFLSSPLPYFHPRIGKKSRDCGADLKEARDENRPLMDAEEKECRYDLKVNSLLGPPFRIFGDIRATTVPQQITEPVGTFVANFAQQVSNLKVNQIAQAFELLAGVEYRIRQWHVPLLDIANNKQLFSMHFVLNGGFITPITPRDSLDVFNVPTGDPTFFTLFPSAQGKKYIAFVSPDRNRFFRQYYGGFRFKTHNGQTNTTKDKTKTEAKTDAKDLEYHTGGMMDVFYGFNESVTGGRLHGGVLRIDGFYPLPWGSNTVYLFGTALAKPARSKITSPLLLTPASGVQVPGPDVAVVTLPTIDRDSYRVGVGVDAVKLFRGIMSKAINKVEGSTKQ